MHTYVHTYIWHTYGNTYIWQWRHAERGRESNDLLVYEALRYYICTGNQGMQSEDVSQTITF
jgi:hypothetical protein